VKLLIDYATLRFVSRNARPPSRRSSCFEGAAAVDPSPLLC